MTLFFGAAITVDHLRYAPLGWSKYYEFSSSDLRCSLNCVDAWIDRASNGPSGSKSASRSVLASTLNAGPSRVILSLW